MKLREAFFRDLPGERQIFDVGERTDGQPVYAAHALLGLPTSSLEWVITFYKYAGDNVSEIYCLKGAWDNRVVLFLDYV
jgi:hypothetical protein